MRRNLNDWSSETERIEESVDRSRILIHEKNLLHGVNFPPVFFLKNVSVPSRRREY